MIFRDVQLVTGGKHSNDKLEQNRYLMNYWDNVEDIFCIFLPTKIDFLGVAKLNVYLGDFRGDEYLPPSTDGVASYRRRDFNYIEFCKLSEREKSVKSLYYIEDSLIKIGKKLNVPSETLMILQSVAQDIIKCNFEVYRTHKKTTKWNKSRNFRVVTTLHHKVGGIDVNIALLDKNGTTLSSQEVVNNQIWNSVWFDFFKGNWDGSAFIIENRVGEETFKLETNEFRVN